MRLLVSTLLFICYVVNTSSAQSPYVLDAKKELSLLATGAGLTGLGYIQKSRTRTFSNEELVALSTDRINNLDRTAINNYSISAHRVSNIFLYSSIATPIYFLAKRKSRNDAFTIGIMRAEAFLLNYGIQMTSKYTFNRTRPFVYNSHVDIIKKQTKNARASFYSGHVSTVAVNTFFAAKVFSDYYPDSKWKPLVWGVAIAAPAITGYYRIKAGKHFFSDVATGYIIGAAIGYLVPCLHKQVNDNKRLQVHAGVNGINVNYKL